MDRRSESGYALVAVLIAIALLLSISALGLSQIQAAAQMGRANMLANVGQYQANAAMKRAMLKVEMSSDPMPPGGCRDPLHDGPPYPPADVPVALTYPDSHHPGTEAPLHHRAKIYGIMQLCDPTDALSAEKRYPQKTSPSLAGSSYYFKYIRGNATGAHSKPSPASDRVDVTAPNEAPAYWPPDDPDYAVFVARTTSPAPPNDDEYHMINSGDRQICNPTGPAPGRPWVCLTRWPSSATPALPLTNTSPMEAWIFAEGWVGDSDDAQAKSALLGKVLRKADGTVTVEYEYDW